jgi:hypothetical protein
MTERDQKMVALVILGCAGIVCIGAVFGWLLGFIFNA